MSFERYGKGFSMLYNSSMTIMYTYRCCRILDILHFTPPRTNFLNALVQQCDAAAAHTHSDDEFDHAATSSLKSAFEAIHCGVTF